MERWNKLNGLPSLSDSIKLAEVLKNAVHPSTKLRTNGGWIEINGEFPFVLRLSKHECLFFQQPASLAGFQRA